MIYLTTNYVDKNLISWIDRIDLAIDKTKKKNIYSRYFNKNFKINNKKNTINFLNFLRKFTKSLKNKDLNKFADFFLDDLNLNAPLISNNDLDKKLSWKDIKQMSKNKLTYFGGHSHNHNILGHLSKSKYKKEILMSLNIFKKKTGNDIFHYSFQRVSNLHSTVI